MGRRWSSLICSRLPGYLARLALMCVILLDMDSFVYSVTSARACVLSDVPLKSSRIARR